MFLLSFGRHFFKLFDIVVVFANRLFVLNVIVLPPGHRVAAPYGLSLLPATLLGDLRLLHYIIDNVLTLRYRPSSLRRHLRQRKARLRFQSISQILSHGRFHVLDLLLEVRILYHAHNILHGQQVLLILV